MKYNFTLTKSDFTQMKKETQKLRKELTKETNFKLSKLT